MVNPLRADYMSKSADDPEYALTTVFNSKWRKYGPACESQGLVFLPLPALTLGSWHPHALAELKKLGRALGRVNSQDEGEATRHLFQRLSILLMKGNSALLISCIPIIDNPEITGIM